MAILLGHIQFYEQLFRMPDFLSEPVLIIGYQVPFYHWSETVPAKSAISALRHNLARRIRSAAGKPKHWDIEVPARFRAAHLGAILGNFGINNVQSIDLMDNRADYNHDLNLPVPPQLHDRYNTIMDIGSIEHIFDTRQVLSNYFAMLKLGGHLLIHTHCKGYYNHGLHLFSPECLLQALELNGLSIRDHFYRTAALNCRRLSTPDSILDATIWIIARKDKIVERFKVPQQGRWKSIYSSEEQTWQWDQQAL